MNKKLISLILVLPLILMISLFTAVNTVSLAVSVPVSKIEILGPEIVYLDLDKQEKHFIEYAVYPTEASNKKVEFSTEANGDARKAELEYKDGYLCPKSVGQAKVILTTVDGGRQASFIVQVEANTLQEIECSVEKSELLIGEKTTISTEFVPRNAPNQQLTYEVVEGADIVSVSSQGVVTGIGVGKATVKVLSRINAEIFDTLEITVSSSAPVQFTEKTVVNTVLQDEGEVPLYIDGTAEFTYTREALQADGSSAATIVDCEMDTDNARLKYAFLDEDFIGSVTVKLTVTQLGKEPYTDSCEIVRIGGIEAVWTEEQATAMSLVMNVGETQTFDFDVTPLSAEIECRVELTNDHGFITVAVDLEKRCATVSAVQAGADAKNSYTDITLVLWHKDAPDNEQTLTMRVNVFSDTFSS